MNKKPVFSEKTGFFVLSVGKCTPDSNQRSRKGHSPGKERNIAEEYPAIQDECDERHVEQRADEICGDCALTP